MQVSAASHRLTPSMVPHRAVQVADQDGDGRTGAAALNDGDAAARAAARVAVSSHGTAAAAAPQNHKGTLDIRA